MGLDMYLECRSNPVDYPEDFDSEVAYWRKANEIHRWFRDNCDPVEGEEEMWYVSRNDICDLIEVCKDIIEHCVIVNVVDPDDNPRFRHTPEAVEYADEHLPTCSGFFFGSTDYDGWYASDVVNTIIKLESVLNNYDDDLFRYVASW